jgi:hypothetical protein
VQFTFIDAQFRLAEKQNNKTGKTAADGSAGKERLDPTPPLGFEESWRFTPKLSRGLDDATRC